MIPGPTSSRPKPAGNLFASTPPSLDRGYAGRVRPGAQYRIGGGTTATDVAGVPVFKGKQAGFFNRMVSQALGGK